MFCDLSRTIEEGPFKKRGLDVQMSAPYEAREKDTADRPIMARLKENMFDCGKADSYNVCEWASIDQVPRDMADVPAVVQELTGSVNHHPDVVDATLKEPFPPISLPKREYMEHAGKIWEELGLPPLKLQAPWFGISLGEWHEDFDVMAERVVKSDYWVTGDIIAQQRRNNVPMNTEIRRLKLKK